MSRADKIHKLANAIRRWRGLAYGKNFRVPPSPAAAMDVVKWLDKLGHPVEVIKAEMQLIAGFQKIADFEAWIQDLDKPAPGSTAAVMGGAV